MRYSQGVCAKNISELLKLVEINKEVELHYVTPDTVVMHSPEPGLLASVLLQLAELEEITKTFPEAVDGLVTHAKKLLNDSPRFRYKVVMEEIPESELL